MRAPFLIGLVGGQRAMTPLATVAIAVSRGELPADGDATRFLARPLVVATTLALAVGELVGDKLETAPDRIVPIGLAARFATSAVAGAVLSQKGRRWLAAGVGGATAVAAAFPGWRIRTFAARRYGPALAAFAEDAVVVAASAAIVRLARSPRPER